MNKTWKSPSFLLSLGLHALIIFLLLFTFEKTIRLPAPTSEESNTPIIDAVMIDHQAVQKEITRLDNIEKQKIEREKARQRELAKKEKEAVEKRKQEELLAIELKNKNEELKKQAEKQRKEEQLEKARLAKEKKQHEEELKKLQKQKEEALAQQKKIEAAKKAAEEIAKQQANSRASAAKLDEYKRLLMNKLHRNWRQPMGFEIVGLKCKIEVKLLPTGEVIYVSIIESSGNLEFDRSAELAVYKSSPLPIIDDPELAKERNFTFFFNPGGLA